jgi:hypothetical protein
MIVIGFDQQDYRFSYLKNKNRKGRSKLHSKARSVIENVFPDLPLYEEVTLPGSKRGIGSSLLIADFFIPDLMLVIESHGQQHYKYIPHFHGARPQGFQNFVKAKIRDNDKVEWCNMNNIDLLEFAYNETEQEWKMKLMQMRPRD